MWRMDCREGDRKGASVRGTVQVRNVEALGKGNGYWSEEN